MRFRFLLTIVLAGLLAACSTDEPETSPTPAPIDPTPGGSQRRVETFEALWKAVDQQFVYEDFTGVDWQAAHDETLLVLPGADTEDEFAQAMRGMLDRLPEGLARYETRAERIEAETADPVNYEGIGAFISFRLEPEPHVVLLSIIPDSPADTAGLEAHDNIYAIDGQAITAEEGLDVVHRLRGPAASSVTLTVQTPGDSRREVNLQRAKLATEDDVRGGVLGGTTVGYMRVPTLGDESLANTLAQGLEDFQSQTELTGLILDLRIAHTGSGWPLSDMLALFGDGEMGEFYSRASTEPIQIEGQNVGASQTLPLILLVGPDTQGLPEILAAALQATERATLVGLPTDGAIEIPTAVPLPDGSRAFIAGTSYRTPDGLDVGRQGLTPDLRVDADWDQITTATDQVLFTALQLLLEE